MKKTNLFRLGILSLVALMVFAGCSSKNDKEAQEAVKTAIANSYKIKSGNYDLTADGKITASNPNVGFEVEGSLNLSGVYDMNKITDPKFTLVFGAKGSADGGDEQSLTGEMRMVNKNGYFIVGNLDSFAAVGPYKDLVAPFLNKWWYVELPAEALQSMRQSLSVYSDVDDSLTPEQKELKKLHDDTMLFTNVKNKGDDEADGVDAIKYSVELDKKALEKYVVESSKLAGRKMSDGDEKEMKEFFKLMNFKGNIWVSKKDNTPVKLDGSFTLAADKKTGNMEFSFDVVYTLSNSNGAVNVEVPVGAEKFDPLATMGAGGGL